MHGPGTACSDINPLRQPLISMTNAALAALLIDHRDDRWVSAALSELLAWRRLVFDTPTIADDLFDCERGVPRSYHQLEDGTQLPYVTLGFIGQNHEADKLSRRLDEEFQRIRASLPESPKPKLIWRLRPSREFSTDGRCSIRTRIAIPGVNWDQFTTKPEGLPYPSLNPE
jgi:hypothetical protein